MRRQTTLKILIVFLATSCSEIRTDDPVKSYKHWAGVNPTGDIKLLKGKYWQSSHWTKEYILYLKFKPTDIWWAEFIKQNHLHPTTQKWNEPSDLPKWFRHRDDFEMFSPTDDIYGSRYFRDKTTGECYIYEMQL
jgi:hypothetical protein